MFLLKPFSRFPDCLVVASWTFYQCLLNILWNISLWAVFSDWLFLSFSFCLSNSLHALLFFHHTHFFPFLLPSLFTSDVLGTYLLISFISFLISSFTHPHHLCFNLVRGFEVCCMFNLNFFFLLKGPYCTIFCVSICSQMSSYNVCKVLHNNFQNVKLFIVF